MTTTSLACRKLTALLDKVNAERLKREFKSFRAFMKELDDSKPAGDPLSPQGPCKLTLAAPKPCMGFALYLRQISAAQYILAHPAVENYACKSPEALVESLPVP